MTTVSDLLARNALFANERWRSELSINPSGNLMVIGCVDPRVDPTSVLGIDQGEAGVIRNVGGRITPATLRTLDLLQRVGAANAAGPRTADWNLVVLHHTDCGMTDLAAFPDLLAGYFEINAADLPAKSVSDPVGSVRVDTEVLLRSLHGPAFYVSGLVYDVSTGTVEVVVPPSALGNIGAAGATGLSSGSPT
jgi:carbonic anhydrase